MLRYIQKGQPTFTFNHDIGIEVKSNVMNQTKIKTLICITTGTKSPQNTYFKVTLLRSVLMMKINPNVLVVFSIILLPLHT